MRCSHILAWIVGLFAAPLLHERLEFLIGLRRQHDADRGEKVAAAVLGRIALAFQAEGAAAAGAGRDGELDRAVESWDPHLGAERRLVERHRQIEPDIGAIEREDRMRAKRQGDQKIAGPVRPGGTLDAQADLLTVGNPGRNLDLDIFAVWETPALCGAMRLTGQRHAQSAGEIAASTAAEILGFETCAASAPARTCAGERVP